MLEYLIPGLKDKTVPLLSTLQLHPRYLNVAPTK